MNAKHTILLGALIIAAALAGCGSPQRTATSSGGNGKYSFWPPPPNEPRIQFLTSYQFSSDIEPAQSGFDKLVFGTEQEVLPIGKPYGLAMWKGRIYVCDIVSPGVVILDLAKRETRVMVARGIEQMVQPTDIDIAPDGMKYVVDRRVGRIFVFDVNDRHVTTFGSRGLIPSGIAVHGDELYVPDFETQSILVMDRFKGDTLRTIGAPGGGEGQFIRPLGVEVDRYGNIFVTDAVRGRVQKFDPEGELMYALGDIGDAPGNFVRPKHVVVDADGVVYIVDAAFQNVQMFNEDGELLMFFGSPGYHLGAMSLPAGITVNEADLDLFESYVHPAFEAKRIVLVTNQFGLHKVAVYALGGLKQGATIDDIAPYAAEVATGTRTEGETPPNPFRQGVEVPVSPQGRPQELPPGAEPGGETEPTADEG